MRRVNSDNCLVMARMNKIKVLIADDDGQLSRRLADFISDHGFEVRTVSNGTDAKFQILDWRPRLVVADLMLPEINAFGLLDVISQAPQMHHQVTQLMVTSGHNNPANVRLCVERGAKDYLVKPFKPDDLLRRLVFHCRSYRHLQEMSRHETKSIDEGSLMLHLTDLVLRQAIAGDTIPNILFNLTKMVAIKLDGVRCSIVDVVDPFKGVVVVSSDDRSATGIELDLNKYPEVVNVMNTQVMIAIENLENSPELKSIRSLLRSTMFNSMIVCPVSRFQKPFGVLSLRMPLEKASISDNEMRFVEIVSHTISLVLSNENHKGISEYWRNTMGDSAVLKFPKTGKK